MTTLFRLPAPLLRAGAALALSAALFAVTVIVPLHTAPAAQVTLIA